LEPLSLIYWIKFCLGAFTAVLCLILNVNNIFTGIVVGALVYAVSNRVLRKLFIGKVENPSIVTKTGIGIYIITWLFLWILLYSLRYAAVI
jgi:hypothetical protein